MAQPQPPEDLGAFLLALRMAAESLRDAGGLSAAQERAVQQVLNQVELDTRLEGGLRSRRRRTLKALRSRLEESCGPEVARLVHERATALHTEHVDALTRAEGDDLPGALDTEAEPGKGGLGSFLAAHNRSVILGMAIVLVLGGAVAMALATWKDRATPAHLVFCAIPLMFFVAARIITTRLGLPRTGHPLFVITLLLIPPAAVATSRGPLLVSCVAVVILSYLAAAGARWALGRGGQGVIVGLVLFSATTVFHDQADAVLGEGVLYLLGSVYAILMAFDFTRRLAREKVGYPVVPARILPYAGVLSYAAAFSILYALLHQQAQLLGQLEILAPVALLVAAPGYFHGSLMYSRAHSGGWGRLVGAVIAFGSLVCTCLSLVLTLMKGVPLLSWSGIVSILFLFAAITFRVRWAHVGFALGLTVFAITAIFLQASGLSVEYPWQALPLQEAALRLLPLVYLLMGVGLALEVSGRDGGEAYLQVALALVSVLVVLVMFFGDRHGTETVLCLSLVPVVLGCGVWREQPPLVALAGVLIYLGAYTAAGTLGWQAPLYEALVAASGTAVALRCCAWLIPTGHLAARTPFLRAMRSLAAGGSILLALSLLGVATVFFHCAGEFIFDPDFRVATGAGLAVTLALVLVGGGLTIPRPLHTSLPRGALIIATGYFLAMWLGVFFVDRGLLTYWQVTACALSALMAFGIGVRLPGVIPVAMVTVIPALGLSVLTLLHHLRPVLPAPDVISCLSTLVAGVVFLRGAAAMESQLAYYLGTMTTSCGALWLSVHLLPAYLPRPAVAVVAASVATVLAVWWTLCATRGWVRPVRFLRAALDSGVLCSMLAAVGLIIYLGLVVYGRLSEDLRPQEIPVAIRLAAIGVALSLVAYYVGAAAAFRSELMVYVAEIAFFGAVTLMRFGFPDLFRDILNRLWLPYIVVALAFAFAAISEFLRRRGLAMFSRPLGITGVFLPVIPLVAIWAALASENQVLFSPDQDHRAFVLGSAALFYLLASNIRRARALTLVAAVFFNLAVWFLYSNLELDFRDLPQLLALPVGLSIVLAAQVNSDRLSQRNLANLRYLGLLVIYLSSAYKMFNVPDLRHAIILLVLSVVGVLVGMAIRIRAFVYLGVTFLVFTVVGRVIQIAEGGRFIWGFFTVTLGLGLFLLIAWSERRDRPSGGTTGSEEPSPDAPEE